MAKKDKAAVGIPGAGRTPEPARVVGIKVQATQIGYYDHKRRREGDVFVIEKPEHFSEIWMERVDARTTEHTTSAPEALKKAQDALSGEKATGDQSVL